jgi:hypothetical protein
VTEQPQAREGGSEASAADAPTLAAPIVPAPAPPTEPPDHVSAPPATLPQRAPAQPPLAPIPAPAYGSATASESERPELAVAAAFTGGIVLALILKRLAR